MDVWIISHIDAILDFWMEFGQGSSFLISMWKSSNTPTFVKRVVNDPQ